MAYAGTMDNFEQVSPLQEQVLERLREMRGVKDETGQALEGLSEEGLNTLRKNAEVGGLGTDAAFEEMEAHNKSIWEKIGSAITAPFRWVRDAMSGMWNWAKEHPLQAVLGVALISGIVLFCWWYLGTSVGAGAVTGAAKAEALGALEGVMPIAPDPMVVQPEIFSEFLNEAAAEAGKLLESGAVPTDEFMLGN